MSEQEIRQRVIQLIMDTTGSSRDELIHCHDIAGELGITGDDFFELMDAFAKEFNVDMAEFLWYFHTREEGTNLGSTFFPSPDQRVERIPISLDNLVNMAQSGKWSVDYPAHKLPKRRRDVQVNGFLLLVFLALAVGVVLQQC